MNIVTKKDFINGSLWKITEQFLTKGVSLLFSIVLTRMISPDAYGLLALTAVFTNLSDILIDGGFGTALIRKKDMDDCDISCVLVVSFSIALFIYVIMFLAAPAISVYYAEPGLTSVLRVIGVIFFIQAFSAVRTAVVNRNMQFKLLFYCNFWGTAIAGIIGIAIAYFGWGVWALVWQRLLQTTISTVLLILKMKIQFTFCFQWKRLKEIFVFSSGVVGASLINYLSSSLYSLVIGKRYSVVDLGYSEKGAQLPTQVSLYTFGAMSSVLLPTLASCQADLPRVRRIVKKVVQMTGYLIAPMMVGLALVSREVIIILFTDIWLPARPVMEANCLYYLATPFMLINVQVYYALGDSRARLKIEWIRMLLQIMGLLVFGIAAKCSIGQLAWVSAVVAVVSAMISFAKVSSMTGYKLREYAKDICLPLTAALLMGCAVFIMEKIVLIRFAEGEVWISLIGKILVGFIIYLFLSILFKIPGFQEIKHILRRDL